MFVPFDNPEEPKRGDLSMALRRLPQHAVLEQTTRLPLFFAGERTLPALEIAALVLFGGLATCAMVFMDWGLKIPGHAILRAVLPMACGLAVVPRRGAGLVMAGGALVTFAGLRLGGHPGAGMGAATSLLLIGPMMDLALWSAKPGFRLYLSFALAGFVTNFAAFAVKGAGKSAGFAGAGGRPLESWLPVAVMSYAVCGLLAGVISAAILFHWQGKTPEGSSSAEPNS